ncbi:receptor-like protein 46 [Pistacia vera]|uniref:receptor-like protein 46 n=1 Tax=Pistacia vera TaxID=55513 RepID=UPI001262D9FC|nr:receptor-like protein 46 [Pistacia vera]
MNRSCLMLLTKSVIPLIIFFVLCEIAEPATDSSAGPAIMPSAESRALSTFILNLEFPSQYNPDQYSYCNEEQDLGYGNVINCTIIDNTWHVTKIVLRDVPLDGYINAAVKNLTYLEILDLSVNKLTGSIPSSLGNLRYLIDLYLYKNFLNHSIPPSFGDLSSLEQT